MNPKKLTVFLISLLLIFILPFCSLAHSGRTDSRGGHRDNKNASGLGYYHYHCGGYSAHLHPNGICPYAPAPRLSASAPVSAKKVTIQQAPKNINVGETAQLTASVSPSNAKNQTISWKSSDESVAAVSKSGKLSAKKSGTVRITASTDNKITASFTLSVKEIPVESIEILNKTETIRSGSGLLLSASVSPENATDKTIRWESSNSAVAAVSKSGEVTAKAPGIAVITAVHNNISSSFELTVQPIEIEQIKILYDGKAIRKGTSCPFLADIYPENASDPSVTWSVSDPEKAVFDGNLLTVSGTGKVKVTAAAANGVSDSVEVELYSYTQGIFIAVMAILPFVIAGILFFIRTRNIKKEKP